MTEKHTKVIDAGDAEIEVVLRGKKGPLVVMYPGNSRGAGDFDHLALDRINNFKGPAFYCRHSSS